MVTALVNNGIGIGAVLLQIFFVGLLLLSVTSEGYYERCRRIVSTHALRIGSIFGVGVVLMSLYYQYIVGFPVCPLCWWQRIALYPLALIFTVAWWKNDRNIFAYVLPLVIFGALFGFYHEWLQVGGASLIPCAADGSSDCAKVYLNIFGYITFPILSLTALGVFGYLGFLLRNNEV